MAKTSFLTCKDYPLFDLHLLGAALVSHLITTQSQSPFEIHHSSENRWLQRFALPQRMFPVVLGSPVLADC